MQRSKNNNIKSHSTITSLYEGLVNDYRVRPYTYAQPKFSEVSGDLITPYDYFKRGNVPWNPAKEKVEKVFGFEYENHAQGEVMTNIPRVWLRGSSELHEKGRGTLYYRGQASNDKLDIELKLMRTLGDLSGSNSRDKVDRFYKFVFGYIVPKIRSRLAKAPDGLQGFEMDRVATIMDFASMAASYHPKHGPSAVNQNPCKDLGDTAAINKIFVDDAIKTWEKIGRTMTLVRGTQTGMEMLSSGMDVVSNAIAMTTLTYAGADAASNPDSYSALLTECKKLWKNMGIPWRGFHGLQGIRIQRKGGSRMVVHVTGDGFKDVGEIDHAVYKIRLIVIMCKTFKIALQKPITALKKSHASNFACFAYSTLDCQRVGEKARKMWLSKGGKPEFISVDCKTFDDNVNGKFVHDNTVNVWQPIAKHLGVWNDVTAAMHSRNDTIMDGVFSDPTLVYNCDSRIASGAGKTDTESRLYIAKIFSFILRDKGYSIGKIEKFLRQGYDENIFLGDFGDDFTIGIDKNGIFKSLNEITDAAAQYGAVLVPEGTTVHLAGIMDFEREGFKPYASVCSLIGSMLFPERPKAHKDLIVLGMVARYEMLVDNPLFDIYEEVSKAFYEFVIGKKWPGYTALAKYVVSEEFQVKLKRIVKKSIVAAKDYNDIVTKFVLRGADSVSDATGGKGFSSGSLENTVLQLLPISSKFSYELDQDDIAESLIEQQILEIERGDKDATVFASSKLSMAEIRKIFGDASKILKVVEKRNKLIVEWNRFCFERGTTPNDKEGVELLTRSGI